MNAGLVFVMVYCILVIIPCVGCCYLGKTMIDKMGHFPSKTPMIQTDIVIKLLFLEIVSFTLLLGFFKALVAE